jgi:hypothetical protein
MRIDLIFKKILIPLPIIKNVGGKKSENLTLL